MRGKHEEIHKTRDRLKQNVLPESKLIMNQSIMR